MFALATLTGCTPRALALEEAVAVARPLSADLGAAAAALHFRTTERDEVERLEWFNGVCEYHAPGWNLGAPMHDRPDDPTLASILAALDPVLIEHGVEPFAPPEAVHSLTLATAQGDNGLTVTFTTVGSLSTTLPVALDEAACTDDALPTD